MSAYIDFRLINSDLAFNFTESLMLIWFKDEIYIYKIMVIGFIYFIATFSVLKYIRLNPE